MFSYVAKSLLSKTLRTFLGKYLENIELESIDYGTDSGKTQNSGGSSGWGVRLSNVKLREGMELVKLPGKRKRVVTRKKKVKRNKSTDEDAEGSVDCDNTPRTKNSKKVIKVEGGESFVLQPKPSTDVGADGNGTENLSTPDADIVGSENLGTSDVGIEKEGIILQPGVTLPLHEQGKARDRLISFDNESGYISSSPPTPTQSSNGICGVPSTFCLNRNSANYAMPHEKELGETLTQSVSADPSKQSSLNQRSQNQVENNPNSSMNDEYDDDESYIEVEEEVTVEDDLALVVGAGGSIGTLNIRLVGKELHVTIEDAHLIIEALPENSNNDKSEKDKNTNIPETNEPNLKRSTSTSILSSQTDLPSMIDGDEGKATIGEKIKNKSKLAKYLSLIPHLFLRDCRVSLLLPEEFGTESTDEDSCAADCTVFELGIDFLSVTSGDDFLDVLHMFDTGNQSSRSTPMSKSQSNRSRRSSSGASEAEAKCLNSLMPNNLFQRKRIRTGRGPESGIWLKIHPPQGKLRLPKSMNHQNGPKWARIRFLESSESFVFRCSGIDLHAKMLVDIKQDDEVGDALSNEYEDYTMDSMLFGVDYVDPICLTRAQIKENMKREPIETPHDSSDVASNTDANGIQSIPFSSNFHWIAKREHREDCTNSHLPLSDCFYCWNESIHHKSTSSSSMNNLMPLPGFVFSLSISDPLELNVDRSSLEALGYMKLLLTSGKSSKRDDSNSKQKAKVDDQSHVEPAPCNDRVSAEFDNTSFPPYMQPDAIYLSGLDVSKVVVRVEAIRSRIDCGPKFCFWQFVGQSIHIEESQVDADELFARDITLHVGGMECKDFSGVTMRNLLVAGEHLENIPLSKTEVCLPNTASRVLGVPSDKRSSKLYAVHGRLLRSNAPKAARDESQQSNKISHANLQLGMFVVDVENTLLRDVSKAFNEAKSIIFVSGEKKTEQNRGPKKSSKWLLHLSTTGGSLSYRPRIKAKIPVGSFQLRRGSEGLSLDTFLQRLGVEYGLYRFTQPRRPSLLPLCSLPESLRMHILVYLDDLTPLERVFNIKKTKKKNTSSFLQIHAINKKLAKLAFISQPEASPKNETRPQKDTIRRGNALNRLQSLDTESLEALLALHDSHRRNKIL